MGAGSSTVKSSGGAASPPPPAAASDLRNKRHSSGASDEDRPHGGSSVAKQQQHTRASDLTEGLAAPEGGSSGQRGSFLPDIRRPAAPPAACSTAAVATLEAQLKMALATVSKLQETVESMQV